MVIFYWTTVSVFVALTIFLGTLFYRLPADSAAGQLTILNRLGVIISNQEHLNADVAALVAAAVAISDEIAALKAQPAAETLDFTGLDNVVATFQGLVPAPAEAPAEPVAVEPPAEPVV